MPSVQYKPPITHNIPPSINHHFELITTHCHHRPLSLVFISHSIILVLFKCTCSSQVCSQFMPMTSLLSTSPPSVSTPLQTIFTPLSPVYIRHSCQHSFQQNFIRFATNFHSRYIQFSLTCCRAIVTPLLQNFNSASSQIFHFRFPEARNFAFVTLQKLSHASFPVNFTSVPRQNFHFRLPPDFHFHFPPILPLSIFPLSFPPQLALGSPQALLMKTHGSLRPYEYRRKVLSRGRRRSLILLSLAPLSKIDVF